MKPRFVHIGFPKTGTTSLYYGFFNNHPDIGYIREPLSVMPVYREILTREEICYSSEKVFNYIKSHIDQAEDDFAKKIIGLSYEGFSFSIDGTYVDRALVAKRLHQLMGGENCKVVIFIRNQFDFIRSIYDEYVKQLGGYFSFEEFLDAQYWRVNTYMFAQLNYYEFYKYYESLFGADNVKVFLFEDLVRKSDETIDDLCSFLDIKKFESKHGHMNPSLSQFSLGLMRLANFLYKKNYGDAYFAKLCPGVSLPENDDWENLMDSKLKRHRNARQFLKRLCWKIDKTFSFKKAKLEYSEKYKRIIEDLYGLSNQQLAADTGLKLSENYYPLSIDDSQRSEVLDESSRLS